MNAKLKNTILVEAVKLFVDKGYDATSIRDIAGQANCSLPMVYYYFNNKEQLFYEVAFNEFIKLNDILNAPLQQEIDIYQIYKKTILSRMNLKGYKRNIYKIALTMYYSNRKDLEVHKQLIEWQKSRPQLAFQSIKRFIGVENQPAANMLSRVVESIITKAILFDQRLTENEIDNELDIIFKYIESIKKNTV